MPRLIAIDLGNHAVKVSTYRLNGRRIDFESRVHQRVPQDGDPPTLGSRMAAMDALLEDHPELASGSGSDVVVAAMPGELSTFHRISMPFTDRAQIEKTLPFAVEGEVPFDLDDMVLGWRMLPGDTKASVLAALVRHDEVSSVIHNLEERSLDPAEVFVDAEVMGLYAESGQVLDGNALHPGSGVAVIDVGHLRTLVTIAVGGQVRHCRAINFGGHTVTRAIQRALGCTWEEAERRKHGNFTHQDDVDLLPDDDEATDVHEAPPGRTGGAYRTLPDAARKAVDGALGLLLAEIRSTLIKAEDSTDASIDEVRLTGGGARLEVLWDFLAADLGVPVHKVSTPDGAAVPGIHALSHALAMHAYGDAVSAAIDLRTGDLEFRGGTNMLRAGLVYGTAGLVFFACAAVVMFAVQYASLISEQGDTDDKTVAILTESFPEIDVDDFAEQRSTKMALAEALTEDAEQRADILGEGSAVPKTVDLLATLTEAFPPHPDVRVDVTSLVITPTQVSFDAETDGGYASSARVESELQKNPLFSRAEKGTEQKRGTSVRFPITIPLGEADEEEG